MKTLRHRFASLFVVCSLLLALPAVALDPHYAGTSTVTDQQFTSTVAAQTNSVTSLTPSTVNSGTNSFVLTANTRFTVPLGNAVHLQLYKTVSGVTTVLLTKTIRGDGDLNLTVTLESVAAATVVGVSVLMDVAGLPVQVRSCTFTAVGLAGASA